MKMICYRVTDFLTLHLYVQGKYSIFIRWQNALVIKGLPPWTGGLKTKTKNTVFLFFSRTSYFNPVIEIVSISQALLNTFLPIVLALHYKLPGGKGEPPRTGAPASWHIGLSCSLIPESDSRVPGPVSSLLTTAFLGMWTPEVDATPV